MSLYSRRFHSRCLPPLICATVLVGAGNRHALGQLDQATLAGNVTDSTGAAIPAADLTLTATGSGLVLRGKSGSNGEFVFSPIKIGSYTLSASAPGMQTTTQENIRVDIGQRLALDLKLEPGLVSDTVTVSSAPSLLQSEQGSIGQVVDTVSINNTPLNGRNWVYIAQLSAGVTPTSGARGGGNGDFNANGQRAQQNNFLLDGVDNNVFLVDFLNGASYVVRPPPDALAEFKIDTSDYSAEFGHSAGAVLSASIKTGSNQIHGDVWEYWRNDILDARNFNALAVPKYRQNQFGATLGLPIIRNRLFFFGDVEANRIVYAETGTYSVPTTLMRTGDFSELLNPSLTASGRAIRLYQPNSSGKTPLTCNGKQNVLCPNQISTLAQKLVNYFPAPNTNNGAAYNNYLVNRNVRDNTFQWDTRVDYNIRSQDQVFARFSYTHEPQYRPPPLGNVLDGGSFQDDGDMVNLAESFALSETHIFTANQVNEFRFGYNYGSFAFLQPNYNQNFAASLGLGGVPYSPEYATGGLPTMNVTGISSFGTVGYLPTKEGQNVYQILDNFTNVIGPHTLKFGVNFQAIRFRTLQVVAPLGQYSYTGLYTSNLGAANTGYGLADFLTNQQNSATLSTISQFNDVRWYRAGYAQDDWRATPRLTINAGLRYDFVQPIRENAGKQANFVVNSSGAPGSGTGLYVIPSQQRGATLAPRFLNELAASHVNLQYSNNPGLIDVQHVNFAPRLGVSYNADDKTVLRGGFGLFFGGLENRGGGTNLGANYPFVFTSSFPAPTCNAASCSSDGISLENGFSAALSTGLLNNVQNPQLNSYDPSLKTPYSIEQNVSVQRSLTNDMAATASYVLAISHHLQVPVRPNSAGAIANSSTSVQTLRPFLSLGDGQWTSAVADSNYNALQLKLEKRFSRGYNFLAAYTYAHSLDDAPTALTSDTNFPNTVLIPIRYSYSNSVFDVRHRFTLNGYYDLPFGKGRARLNQGGALNEIFGGWSTSLTFIASTGTPFTVRPANINTPAGLNNNLALPVHDPFQAGGTPDPSNPTITCATRTRTRQHWYNPCAFANPLNGAAIPAGAQISSLPAVLQYLGGRRNNVYGPGLTRLNMSLFKNFITLREQYLQVRIDAFNLMNTPAYGNPSTADTSSNGGLITAPQQLQNLTPDARFFQLAAKYVF